MKKYSLIKINHCDSNHIIPLLEDSLVLLDLKINKLKFIISALKNDEVCIIDGQYYINVSNAATSGNERGPHFKNIFETDGPVTKQ